MTQPSDDDVRAALAGLDKVAAAESLVVGWWGVGFSAFLSLVALTVFLWAAGIPLNPMTWFEDSPPPEQAPAISEAGPILHTGQPSILLPETPSDDDGRAEEDSADSFAPDVGGLSPRERRCNSGDSQACYNLGVSVIHSDPERAEWYWSRSCRIGSDEVYVRGCVALGNSLIQGLHGIDEDKERGAALLEFACVDRRSWSACDYLARAYRFAWVPNPKGRQVPDHKRAKKLYERACLGGRESACEVMAGEYGPSKTRAKYRSILEELQSP